MSRNVEIDVYGYEYLVSVDGAGVNDGAMPEETSG